MDIDVGHFEVAPETGSAPGRIVLWDCFGILPHFLLVIMMFCGKKKQSHRTFNRTVNRTQCNLTQNPSSPLNSLKVAN